MWRCLSNYYLTQSIYVWHFWYTAQISDNVSVKSKLQHAPPPSNPLSIWLFLTIIVQIPPYAGQNAIQMPHTMVHSGDQMPPPWEHFTGTKMTERQRKRLQLSNKIFINITKLRNTVSIFTKNKSRVQSGGNRCYKVTECSKRSIKKDPIYWDYYIMTISLICIITHIIN